MYLNFKTLVARKKVIHFVKQKPCFSEKLLGVAKESLVTGILGCVFSECRRQSLHTFLVAGHNAVQVVKVIIVIAGGAEDFEGHVTDDGRSSMVEEQELPLHAVLRGELIARRINDAHLATQLRRLDASRAHKDQFPVHLDTGMHLEDARQFLTALTTLTLAMTVVRLGLGIRIVAKVAHEFNQLIGIAVDFLQSAPFQVRVERDLVGLTDVRLMGLDHWSGIEEDVEQRLVIRFVGQIVDAPVVQIMLCEKEQSLIYNRRKLTHTF